MASRRNVRTCSVSSTTLVGGSPASAMPASARIGSIVASRRSSARRGSLSRRNPKTSSAPDWSSAAGSARVGSSAASSQSSSDDGALSHHGPVRLVEPEPEIPWRPRSAREAAVDPGREPALERGVSGLGRQIRRGRREPREEPLRGAVRSGRRARHRDIRRAERTPGELVDGAAVEVVDEGARVPVERVCGGGRCGVAPARRAPRRRARRASRPRARASGRRQPGGADGRARRRPSVVRRRGRLRRPGRCLRARAREGVRRPARGARRARAAGR